MHGRGIENARDERPWMALYGRDSDRNAIPAAPQQIRILLFYNRALRRHISQ